MTDARDVMQRARRLARMEPPAGSAKRALARARRTVDSPAGRGWALPAVVGLAAAMALATGLWWMTQRPPEAVPTVVQETVEQVDTSDEAFERWAAPYRKLRVPMVTREQAGAYAEPAIPVSRAHHF